MCVFSKHARVHPYNVIFPPISVVKLVRAMGWMVIQEGAEHSFKALWSTRGCIFQKQPSNLIFADYIPKHHQGAPFAFV